MNSQNSDLFSIKLSAPGKVILFGEYSVVFNKPAIAASLGLRTKLHLRETTSHDIELDFTAIGLVKKFPLKDIKEYIMSVSLEYQETPLQSLTEAVEHLHNKIYKSSHLSDAQLLSLVTFFYIYKKLSGPRKGFHLRIVSELPVGAGVGSSASFSVVLCAALLALDYYNNDRERFAEIFDRSEKKIILDKIKHQISEAAFSCEKIFHGTPSGVDHNTILHGFMLEFIKSDTGNKISFINTCPIKILLVNTNVPRSTRKVLSSVKELKENHSSVIECVLKGMEYIAREAVEHLKGLKENPSNLKKFEKSLGELVSLNHNMLRVLGASHPTLEEIVSTAAKYKLHAKLTGGGGGGFGFIYIPTNAEPSIIKTVEKELNQAGFTTYEVILGDSGLLIEEIIY